MLVQVNFPFQLTFKCKFDLIDLPLLYVQLLCSLCQAQLHMYLYTMLLKPMQLAIALLFIDLSHAITTRCTQELCWRFAG